MTAKPAARVGDATEHGLPVTGMGSGNVMINSRPAWRSGDTHVCVKHGPEMVLMGSETVRVNSSRAARESDYLQGPGGPNRIGSGSSNVVIGSPLDSMSSQARVDAFCSSFCALKRDWAKLTPAERRERYQQILDEECARFGAPPVGFATKTMGPGAEATWNQRAWRINLAENSFDGPSMPPRFNENTAHEVRHAEQTFGALQAAAGRTGAGPEILSRAAGVPYHVAEGAAAQPIDDDSARSRWSHLMADEQLSPGGRAAMNRAIDGVYTAGKGEGGTASEAYRKAAEAYSHRPGGADADEWEKASKCNC